MTDQAQSQEEVKPPVQDVKDAAGSAEDVNHVKHDTTIKEENLSNESSNSPTKEIEDTVKVKTDVASAEETTKDGIDHANEAQETTKAEVEDTSAIESAAKDSLADGAQAKDTDNVEESSKDVKDIDRANEVKASENGVSSQPEPPSKRVQEGQKWNNRDRDRVDYKKNIKSDLTSQEESSDPIAIRKQVKTPITLCGLH